MYLRLVLVVAFTVAFAASVRPLPGQSTGSPLKSATDGAPSAEVARKIADVVARLDIALAGRDRAALEPLVAIPFTWVHASDGRVEPREVWLANAARGMALSGQRLDRSEHGPDLVVHAAPEPHTAIRVARVRLLDSASKRETWLRQTQVFVRGVDGVWRLAWGQGVVMYDGPPLDAALHPRYAGTYVIAPGRVLKLTWEDGALLADFPDGARAQIFLASPTEEAVRTVALPRLRFALGPDGRPVAATLRRGDQEIWRATRTSP